MNPTADMIPSLKRRGVPERTIRAALATTDTDAIRFTSDGWTGLRVLGGRPGVGKSVAALLWLLEQAKGKPECLRWVQSGDLARGFAYDRDEFETLCSTYALVVDDLGLEYLDENGRFLCTLDEVLSKRFAKMRRTLITTNITDAKVFSERYKERIASRISEDGAFIVCGGADLRRIKNTNERVTA